MVSDQYSVLAGFRMDLAETWELEASANYSYSLRSGRGVSGYVRREDLRNALKSTFNPLALDGKRGDISNLEYQTWRSSSSKLLLGEVAATGELLNLGEAGPLSAAVGIQAHNEVFRIDGDEASRNDQVVSFWRKEVICSKKRLFWLHGVCSSCNAFGRAGFGGKAGCLL